jgi:hypothetical protein|tara:strand:- start:177 stop:740 length:564 start_codon:yes stop_codon:yes gene_type:complete
MLLACIVGFVALPLMGLDTFNLELYNNFPLIPEAYIPYVSYPIFYFCLIGCSVGINMSWKRIFNSNIVMKINKDGFWADLENQIDVDLKWEEIESFKLKVRKVSGRYLEFLVINPKDISIAQRVNRLSGHDSSTAASFMKWTKKTLGKAATVGIYDPHKQIAIYLEGFQYKPEKIIMKMEEYFEENK